MTLGYLSYNRSQKKEAQDKVHLLENELSKLQKQLQAERAQYYTLQQQDCDLIQVDRSCIDLIYTDNLIWSNFFCFEVFLTQCLLFFKYQEMRIKLSEALDGQAALRLQLQSQMNKRQTSLNDMKNVHVSK